jgi:hypothetical protein
MLEIAVNLKDEAAIKQLNSLMDKLQNAADSKELTANLKVQTAEAL